jgi:hypothetical protein
MRGAREFDASLLDIAVELFRGKQRFIGTLLKTVDLNTCAEPRIENDRTSHHDRINENEIEMAV